MPKREIFVTELFILSDPIWVGDLRNEPKKHLCKVLGRYSGILFFTDDWVCGKNYSPPTEYCSKAATTNFEFWPSLNFLFIYRTLSMRQKTENVRNQGSNDKKMDFLVQSLSHIPRWVRLVQKTRAKKFHAWAPLRFFKDFFWNVVCLSNTGKIIKFFCRRSTHTVCTLPKTVKLKTVSKLWHLIQN